MFFRIYSVVVNPKVIQIEEMKHRTFAHPPTRAVYMGLFYGNPKLYGNQFKIHFVVEEHQQIFTGFRENFSVLISFKNWIYLI